MIICSLLLCTSSNLASWHYESYITQCWILFSSFFEECLTFFLNFSCRLAYIFFLVLRFVGAGLVIISHPLWCVPFRVSGVQMVPNYPTPLMEEVENPPALRGLFPFAHLTAPHLYSDQLHGASLCNMFSFLYMNSYGQRKPGENFHSFLPHSILLSCTRPYKSHTLVSSSPHLDCPSSARLLSSDDGVLLPSTPAQDDSPGPKAGLHHLYPFSKDTVLSCLLSALWK